MKKKVVVLGCGLVGPTIVQDLAADTALDVSVADISERSLRSVSKGATVQTLRMDLSDTDRLRQVIQGFDLVVGSMPSRFAFQTLRTVLEAGKPYADISFMPEDPLALDELARAQGVTAVVDCGVAPGLSNLIVGHVNAQLDSTERIEIYVGGLPKVRQWPYQYKAPFAPSDVIEEYTRPARFVVGGRLVVKQALTDPELIELPRVGTLEAFNTDGLRTLLNTVRAQDMVEKTLRYPGHCELMRVLRETGFFSKAPVEVGGRSVKPIDLTAELLFPRWTYYEGEEEFTVMRVVVAGRKGRERVRHTYELYDETDRKTGVSSMSRTTGFPCAIVARMLARDEIQQRGVLPPELLARGPGIFDRVVAGLQERGVSLTSSVRSESCEI